MRVIVLFVVLGLVLVVNQSAQSADITCPRVARVVESGDEIKVHRVSPTSPLLTEREDWHTSIQDAINHADGRELILVAPGVPSERLVFKPYTHLEGEEGAILSDRGLAVSSKPHIALVGVTRARILDLQIETSTSAHAIYLRCSTGNSIEGNTLHVSGSANGITFQDGSNNNELNGNLIVGNNVLRQNRPDRAQVGIYYRAPSEFNGPITRNNKTRENTVSGFVTGVRYDGVDRIPFYDNIVTANYLGIDQFWVHAGQIFYNEITFNGDPRTGGGGGLRMRATDSTDTNDNIISNNAGYGISRELVETPNPFANPKGSDFWGNRENDLSEIHFNDITNNGTLDLSIQTVFPDDGARSNDAHDDPGRGNQYRNNQVSSGIGDDR